MRNRFFPKRERSGEDSQRIMGAEHMEEWCVGLGGRAWEREGGRSLYHFYLLLV